MSMRFLLTLGLLGAGWTMPLCSEDHLTTNMGGGISTPVNPTGAYTGVSGNVVIGTGYRLNKRNSLLGEFMWTGLPPDVTNIHLPNVPYGNINLYSLTANYRHHIDSVRGSPFGVYAIAGGGWYYRYAAINKNYTLPSGAPCAPIYYWWGYSCGPGGYIYSETIASRGTSAGGVNGGVGFTIRFADSQWKFYTEARYHYAFSDRISTVVIPVTFGIRYN